VKRRKCCGSSSEGEVDCRRKWEAAREEWVEEEQPEARSLDLKKAYLRVNRPAKWQLLGRYGLEGRFVDTLKGLHESTSYRVKGGRG